MKTTAKLYFYLGAIVVIFLTSSCQRRIGDLTMISTRNIDTKTEYKELSRYTKGKGKTIEEAVEKSVKQIQGGEYLKNVIVYSRGKKFKVEGDVWGVNPESTANTFIDFAVGDTISFKSGSSFYDGTIVKVERSPQGFIATVKYEGKTISGKLREKVKEVPVSDLIKK